MGHRGPWLEGLSLEPRGFFEHLLVLPCKNHLIGKFNGKLERPKARQDQQGHGHFGCEDFGSSST